MRPNWQPGHFHTPRPPVLLLALALLLASAPLSVLAAGAAEPPPPDPAGMLGTTSGEVIYAQICQGCHMPGGRGAVGAGRYPAFAGNPNLASSRYMAVTILGGRRNMPSFAKPRQNDFYFSTVWLTDTQVANVINYIRGNFGNAYRDPITAADVATLRPKE